MYSELEKVMEHSQDGTNIFESLGNNVTGKKSSSGVKKTAAYLKRLYGFDDNNSFFNAFRYFWKLAESSQKPLIAFIYAVVRDNMLAESIDVMRTSQLNEKILIETFEENIERCHPKKYSKNTRKSTAQNICSSWKQAGFVIGKVKNIRVQPDIDSFIVCFAFLMAYMNGERGEYILNSQVVRSLCLTEGKLKELAIECGKRGLMNYQSSGSVTNIAFHDLSRKLQIHEYSN